jgi:hypothetical protein
MLGTCTALLSARRGLSVSLFDAQPEPMCCAGRWNEGKIHQGYIYAADNTLATAKRLLPGARSFDRIVSSLIEEPTSKRKTRGADLLLNHVDSVVQPGDAFQYLKAVWVLSREAGFNTSPPEQLSERQLRAITDHPSISAACTTPEQSIDTNWVADQLVKRVKNEDRIEGRFGEKVTDILKHDSNWSIVSDKGMTDGFDVVVNALWEGRSAIDAKRGLSSPLLSYRYRVSAFAQIDACELPNFVIATGPFGDFKNYGSSLYLSWYPTGLLVDEIAQFAPEAPRVSPEKKLAIANTTIRNLAEFIPDIARLKETAHAWTVQGGWVVARGKGPLSELSSGLHRRDLFGIQRLGSYFSVDVGKYSMAPLLAEQIVNEVIG